MSKTPLLQDTEFLEEIKGACPQKKITGLCDRLIRKNSYKSGKDCEALCDLAFRLYLCGRGDLSLRCIAPTHEIAYFKDALVWGYIHHMWGLEIRIARELGMPDRREALAGEIDAHLLTPAPGSELTDAQRRAREERRRGRIDWDWVTKEDKIQQSLDAGKPAWANDRRFAAIQEMIGYGETGLYPRLNERRDDLEEKIAQYRAALPG